ICGSINTMFMEVKTVVRLLFMNQFAFAGEVVKLLLQEKTCRAWQSLACRPLSARLSFSLDTARLCRFLR
ncbi:MAG: hypothetical protein RSC36_07640, partial [Ruthenibacterium sp.]